MNLKLLTAALFSSAVAIVATRAIAKPAARPHHRSAAKTVTATEDAASPSPGKGKATSQGPTRTPPKPGQEPEDMRRAAPRDRFREEMEETSVRAVDDEAQRGEGSEFNRWFYGQRAYPAGSIPLGARTRALR